MDINIKKRHILLLFGLLLGISLIIPNYQTIKKISNAKELSGLNEPYHYGDYVKVNFNEILYIEYEGVSGTQKRYAVCSTLESDVFYVNGLPEKFVLVEITDTKMIEEIESSQNKSYQMIGMIKKYTDDIYDLSDFLPRWNSVVKLENTIIIKEVIESDIYARHILNGCFIIFFCVILFLLGQSKGTRQP